MRGLAAIVSLLQLFAHLREPGQKNPCPPLVTGSISLSLVVRFFFMLAMRVFMPQYSFPALPQVDCIAGDHQDIRSTLVSRNITVSGRRTSVRLEPQMWQGLQDICKRERATIHEVCTYISMHKDRATSLTAAIRVYIMEYFRVASTEEGHARARHGRGLVFDPAGSATLAPVSTLAIVAGAAHTSAKADSVSGQFSIGAQNTR